MKHILGTSNCIANILSRVYSEKNSELGFMAKKIQNNYVWDQIDSLYFDVVPYYLW